MPLHPPVRKTVIGTRRIIMTKGADGTTRVVSQPISVAKTPQPAETVKAAATPQKEGPQKFKSFELPTES